MTSRIAVVNFPHSLSSTGFGEKEYHYKTYLDIHLAKGNLVVVETQTGYSVARFVRYAETSPVENLKWIVQKVDIKKHKKLKEQCEIGDLLD